MNGSSSAPPSSSAAASTSSGARPSAPARPPERPAGASLVRDPGGSHIPGMSDFLLKPDPDDPRLTRRVPGIDQDGKPIVTMMTVGDFPDYLAVGYLLNQNMLQPDDAITGIDHDAELETVVVRTKRKTDYEKKLRKKTLTSGCAQGTVFGDVMEKFDAIKLDPAAELRTSWLYALS